MGDIRNLEKITNVSQIKLGRHVYVRDIFIGFCAEQSGDWEEATIKSIPKLDDNGAYRFIIDYLKSPENRDLNVKPFLLTDKNGSNFYYSSTSLQNKNLSINPYLLAGTNGNILDIGFGFDSSTRKIMHPKYELKKAE